MILYIQTAFLGDLLLSVPALKRLRKLYPGQEIHLLCRKGLGEFFVRERLADRVFDQFKKDKPSLSEIKTLFEGLHYSLLICPHQSTRSSLIARRIRADKKIGFDGFLNRFVFTETYPRPMKWPETLRQLSLLKNLDRELAAEFVKVAGRGAPFKEIPEWSSMAQPRFLERLSHRQHLAEKLSLDAGKKMILFAPGSVWATKRWGASKFIELAKLLLERGDQVVLVGSPAEKGLAAFIASKVPALVDITGTTKIADMVELIAGADALISNDSGAMHMASVAGTPTVAVFGPTVQGFGYQPWNPRSVVVENVDLYCRPCSSHGGPKCPISTHECMTSISAQSVLAAMDALLQNHATPS
jgi:heptosyltransferase-2